MTSEPGVVQRSSFEQKAKEGCSFDSQWVVVKGLGPGLTPTPWPLHGAEPQLGEDPAA